MAFLSKQLQVTHTIGGKRTDAPFPPQIFPRFAGPYTDLFRMFYLFEGFLEIEALVMLARAVVASQAVFLSG